MAPTRLLVLGVVRIFQPVHGYDVVRELRTWRADTWANVAPGSVYNMLKSLDRDGLVEVAGTDQQGGRPARTAYRVTPEGDKEFATMLRETWWTVGCLSDPLMTAISFMPFMNREELVAALRSRVAQIEALLAGDFYKIKNVGGDPAQGGTPEHVAEAWRLVDARMSGEADWARALAERLEAGAYDLLDTTPDAGQEPTP